MNQVVYVLRFDSYDDLKRRWAAFFADPEWAEAKALSEVDARSWPRCSGGSSPPRRSREVTPVATGSGAKPGPAAPAPPTRFTGRTLQPGLSPLDVRKVRT
ncbi:NIPSNAP family protein [Streptomyces brevispora]